MDTMTGFKRTHYCGTLRAETLGKPSPSAAGSSGSVTWAA